MSATEQVARLRAAADLIEQRASAASPGPWRAVEWYAGSLEVVDRAGAGIATESSTGDVKMSDARWMAMLGPQVAAPLAAWLRAEADDADLIVAGNLVGGSAGKATTAAALIVADVILAAQESR